MSKKKDCFGSETYVCRTQNCAYMSDCVKVVWEKKLNNVSTRLSFGEASSPVVHGDVVLMTRDNETDSRILALDAGE